MPRVIWHLILWVIALAVLGIILLFLGFYLYAGVQPLYEKPLVEFTLKDLGHLVLMGLVAIGGPSMFVVGIGQMIETAQEDLDDWRRLKHRIKCPRCGELAWNDDEHARCPFCQWDSDYSYEEP